AKAAGGSLHVRRPAMLPGDELRAFWGASSFRPSAGVEPRLGNAALPENRIVIPDLADRPADLLPIAEKMLHTVDAQLSRRRSSFRAETRALLQQLPVPENVRTLRNVVAQAALGATSTEVGLEHFDMSRAAPIALGMRAKIRETERREIAAA